MNELSRKMYDKIPYGGSLFTIDKIGLRIETKYINITNAKKWFKGNPINIMIFGNTAQINVHAEFKPNEKHLGKKCLEAIILLLYDGVFTTTFSCLFNKIFLSYFPFILFNNFLTVMVLSNFFTLAEWENTIDFLDIFPFSNINTDKNNPKSLKRFKNSFYSRDDKKKYRTVNENGKEFLEIKSVQKSLVCGYDKAIKIGSERLIFRVEIKYQGKYKNNLNMLLLNGTAEEAFYVMLPLIKINLNKVIDDNTFILNDYWLNNTPEQFKKLFMKND